MKKFSLEYPLSDGYIDHWLTADLAPKEIKVKTQGSEAALEFRRRILDESFRNLLPYTTPPVELEKTSSAYWLVSHCKADHLLETTIHAPTWQLVERWSYAQLVMPAAASVRVEMAASGAAAVWCNGDLVYRCLEIQPLDYQGHTNHAFMLNLKRGANHLYLQSEEAALGDALLSNAVHLSGPGLDSAAVHLLVQNENTSQRKAVEAIYEIASLSQAVYTYEDRISLNCADRVMGKASCVIRLQDIYGGIRAETFNTIEPGATINSIVSYQLPEGPMEARIMPEPDLFYNEKFHAERVIPFQNAPVKVSLEAEDTYENRLVRLMQEGARAGGIFGEITKMLLGWWEIVDREEIGKAVKSVRQRSTGCLIDLLGLIGMVTRLAKEKQFPADLLPEIEAAITAFPYSPEKVFRPLEMGETNRLVLAACQVLAGQQYSRRHFDISGRTGAKERKMGEEVLTTLLQQCGKLGWRDGNAHLDERVSALAHLADLARDNTIAELAAVLLDQTAFTLAQYSFQGMLGTPQIEAIPSQLKTGRLTSAASLNRLLFGMGCYHKKLVGALSLGMANEYSLPELVRSIALEKPEGAWTMEHSARPDENWEVNQVAYKTTDFMLSSLQDYQSGDWGGMVHPWQATLGPEAVVFSSHPTALNQSDQRQAGKWCGSGALPRVAQWQDALISLFQLSENERLGYSHAYFPTFAFDEYRLEKGWAFARKNNGYLAIYASDGFSLVENGDDAYFELIAPGTQTAWLVQMGRRTTDGDFADFYNNVLAKPVKVEGLAVEWQTLRGDLLEFDWSGPLQRNGAALPLRFSKRFEGPFVDAAFPAEVMDIGYGDQMLRLNFS